MTEDRGRRYDDSYGFIRRNWAIIVVAAGILLSWGAISANIQNIEKRVTYTEAEVKNISGLQQDVNWIKSSLTRIEDRLNKR